MGVGGDGFDFVLVGAAFKAEFVAGGELAGEGCFLTFDGTAGHDNCALH